MRIVSNNESEEAMKELMQIAFRECKAVEKETIIACMQDGIPLDKLGSAVATQIYLHGLVNMMRAYEQEKGNIDDPDKNNIARLKELCMPVFGRLKEALKTIKEKDGPGPNPINRL